MRYLSVVLEGLQATAWAVRRLQHRHSLLLAEALAPLKITITQWVALRSVHDHPEDSLHDLAARDGQSDQAFGALASRMVAAGLLERVPAPRGRAIRHTLTEQGEDLRIRAASVVDAVLARSFAGLSGDEQEQLSDLLHRVLMTAPESAARPALPRLPIEEDQT